MSDEIMVQQQGWCKTGDNLEKARDIIKGNYVPCGIFRCRNITGDTMRTIYKDDKLQIYICDYYEYFEVFGLTDDEFEKLEKYYIGLARSH